MISALTEAWPHLAELGQMLPIHVLPVHELGMVTPTPGPVATGTAGGVPGIDLSGGGQAPPGSEKILLMLKWGFWGVSAVLVGGVLYVAGKMAVQHGRGEGGEHARGLALVLLAAVLAASATGIIGALL